MEEACIVEVPLLRGPQASEETEEGGLATAVGPRYEERFACMMIMMIMMMMMMMMMVMVMVVTILVKR